MKTIQLFAIAALTLVMASCASPEERAARLNNTVDTSKSTTETTAEAAVTDSNKTDTMAAAPAVAAVPAEPAKEEMVGEGLIKKSDCLACHNATKKLVGPAYVNVAGKYPANEENIALLADKIINGGAGVWGDVPMSPHPSVSKDDAKEMVKYILSLKK